MDEIKTEGIVLKAIAYQDKDRIVTLFTKNEGVISLFVKKASSHSAITSPFSLAEYVYKRGRKDLNYFIDGSLIDPQFLLREKYESIQTASKITKTILQSQLPGKISPKLYELFKIYLKKIPSFESCDSLFYSFILKLLLHDGFLAASNTCSLCTKNAISIAQGESYCMDHKPSTAPIFIEQEWATLQTLLISRYFKDLDNIKMSAEFNFKIYSLFLNHLKDR